MVIFPPPQEQHAEAYEQFRAYGSTVHIFLSQLNNLSGQNSIFIHIHGKTDQNSCVFKRDIVPTPLCHPAK